MIFLFRVKSLTYALREKIELFSECYEKNVECFQGNSKVTGLFNKRAYKTHLNMEDIYIIISKYLLGTASPQEEKGNHGMAEC